MSEPSFLSFFKESQHLLHRPRVHDIFALGPTAARLRDAAFKECVMYCGMRVGIDGHLYAGLHALANVFVLKVAPLGELPLVLMIRPVG